MRSLVAVLVLCVVALPSVQAQEGRLQQVRDEVNHPDKSPSDKGKKKKDDSSSDSSEDEDNGSAEGFSLLFLAPFLLPHAALNDKFDKVRLFSHYPYASSRDGYLLLDPEDETGRNGLRGWAATVSVEDGNDFRGLNRVGGKLFLDTWTRFGVQTRVDYFTERLSCGCLDDLLLGSSELTFRFAQGERARMIAGLGANYMDDHNRSRFGFNFTYGADLFPVRPLVLSLSLDAGTLGSAGVFRAHGTVGAIWKNWEFFTGYDYRRIGSTELQGPLLGLRLWF
jgi:hypothetical protein